MATTTWDPVGTVAEAAGRTAAPPADDEPADDEAPEDAFDDDVDEDVEARATTTTATVSTARTAPTTSQVRRLTPPRPCAGLG